MDNTFPVVCEKEEVLFDRPSGEITLVNLEKPGTCIYELIESFGLSGVCFILRM